MPSLNTSPLLFDYEKYPYTYQGRKVLGYWVILLKLHAGLKEFQLTLEVFHYYRELDFKVQLHLHFNFIHNEIYLWETFLSSFRSIRFLNLLTTLQRRNSFFFSIKIEDLWGRPYLCSKKVFVWRVLNTLSLKLGLLASSYYSLKFIGMGGKFQWW